MMLFDFVSPMAWMMCQYGRMCDFTDYVLLCVPVVVISSAYFISCVCLERVGLMYSGNIWHV